METNVVMRLMSALPGKDDELAQLLFDAANLIIRLERENTTLRGKVERGEVETPWKKTAEG